MVTLNKLCGNPKPSFTTDLVTRFYVSSSTVSIYIHTTTTNTYYSDRKRKKGWKLFFLPVYLLQRIRQRFQTLRFNDFILQSAKFHYGSVIKYVREIFEKTLRIREYKMFVFRKIFRTC